MKMGIGATRVVGVRKAVIGIHKQRPKIKRKKNTPTHSAHGAATDIKIRQKVAVARTAEMCGNKAKP